MKSDLRLPLMLVLSAMIIFPACKKRDVHPSKNCFTTENENKTWKKMNSSGSGTVTLFASGLNNPRGLKFGPDCKLYVAEAGLGNGTENTDEECPEQVPFDAPYMGSTTGGRISMFGPDGVRMTVTDELPTVRSSFNDILGPSDIAFIGNDLYVLVFAGCGHGVPSVPHGILKLHPDGSFDIVADLGAWRMANPVASPPVDDFDPAGTFHSMIAIGDELYAVDANHGDIVKVTTSGVITRVVDISAKYGHIVPTVLAYKGSLYMGNLGLFPIVDGSSNIYKIRNNGETEIVATGLTSILGLVFDKKGSMYILETTTGNDFPTPGAGRIVRVNPNGTKDIIATGFSNPTAMTYGPDGNLYVLNWGFGAEEEEGGEVLRVSL